MCLQRQNSQIYSRWTLFSSWRNVLAQTRLTLRLNSIRGTLGNQSRGNVHLSSDIMESLVTVLKHNDVVKLLLFYFHYHFHNWFRGLPSLNVRCGQGIPTPNFKVSHFCPYGSKSVYICSPWWSQTLTQKWRTKIELFDLKTISTCAQSNGLTDAQSNGLTA